MHFWSMGLEKRGHCVREVGKKAKQRFTVTLVANAARGKESAIVIWKAEKPRCIKGVDLSKLATSALFQPGQCMDDWRNIR